MFQGGLPAVDLRLDHLRRLTDERGLFEHALYDKPRHDHGYTTDDNARALVVLSRAGDLGVEADLNPYLDFVVSGAVAGGWHNRMTASGEWDDLRGSDDCHGRAIWGLGEAIGHGLAGQDAIEVFQAGVHTFSSAHPRSLSYALFGVLAALDVHRDDPLLETFVTRAAGVLPDLGSGAWLWPAERLTYDNARLPEAMIRAGRFTGDATLVERGLALLDWLAGQEWGGDGFSFTPVGGRGRGDSKPAFDQQPIEAWAMADASTAANAEDPNQRWVDNVVRSAAWFFGENDANEHLYAPHTGAGYDGLERDGVNENCGAESTLSALGSIVRWHQMEGRDRSCASA